MEKIKTMVKNFLGNKGLPLLELYYFGRYWLNRGSLRYCPCCEKEVARFLPADVGLQPDLPEVRCPRCDSHPRHRLLWLFLKENYTNFFTDPLRLLHLAPEFCFLRRLKAIKTLDYLTGDLDSPLANERLDVTCLPYRDDFFDVIFCNHVLEHVIDDSKAMRELCRVLKPGGRALLQVPVVLDRTTYENWGIKEPEERAKHFGQKDHVRIYGTDYPERLQRADFDVSVVDFLSNFDEGQSEYYGFGKSEPVFLCTKPEKDLYSRGPVA